MENRSGTEIKSIIAVHLIYCGNIIEGLSGPKVQLWRAVGETGWSLIKNLQFAGRRMAKGQRGLCNAGDLRTLSRQRHSFVWGCIN